MSSSFARLGEKTDGPLFCNWVDPGRRLANTGSAAARSKFSVCDVKVWGDSIVFAGANMAKGAVVSALIMATARMALIRIPRRTGVCDIRPSRDARGKCTVFEFNAP